MACVKLECNNSVVSLFKDDEFSCSFLKLLDEIISPSKLIELQSADDFENNSELHKARMVIIDPERFSNDVEFEEYCDRLAAQNSDLVIAILYNPSHADVGKWLVNDSYVVLLKVESEIIDTTRILGEFLMSDYGEDDHRKLQKELCHLLLERLAMAYSCLNTTLQEQSRLATLGHLVAGVGHELNNMLGCLSGMAELSCMNKDRLERLPVKLLEQCERGTEIVETLLSFTSSKSKKIKCLSVQDELKSIVHLVEYQLISKNIAVEFYIADNLTLCFYKGMLQQIILNILLNAIHALPFDGIIKLSAIKISTDIIITVADNGPGIEPSVLSTIFTPFVTTKREQGTGLGLATCKQFLDEVGGDIVVTSELGKGATFTVKLPQLTETCLENREEFKQKTVDFTGKSILVVEDNEVISDMVRELLHELKFFVDNAVDGDAALQLLEENVYDSIYVDVNLPGSLSGFDLIKHIRATDQDTRIVLATGQLVGNEFAEVEGLYDVLVRKPFRFNEILQALDETK